jgi:hypothetical protein
VPTNLKPPAGDSLDLSPAGERFQPAGGRATPPIGGTSPHHAAEYAALLEAEAGEGLAQKQKSANGANPEKCQDANPPPMSPADIVKSPTGGAELVDNLLPMGDITITTAPCRS